MSIVKSILFFVALVIVAVPSAMAQEAGPNWNESEYVFTGKLTQVVAGPVGMSEPPLYTHTLHFTVEKVLRGGLKPGEKLVCSHSVQQPAMPVFPEGKVCLVAASRAQGDMRVAVVQEADTKAVAAATAACAMPLGWTVEGGKPVSPWAAQGKAAWPAGLDLGGKVKCSKTGRPALLVGPGVTLAVEPVPPKKAIEWTNPDGDGEYKVTVTNTTNKAVSVPALLSDGKKILWEDSLVILCQGKAYTCPGSKGVSGKVQPAEIPAGKSVSTVVNSFRLEGPEWPQGGYRIEFQFCLGEKSQTKSFYYMARHHDKLRDEARAADAKKETPAPPKPPTPPQKEQKMTPYGTQELRPTPASASQSPVKAEARGPDKETNAIGMKMVLIPAGELAMGSRESAEELAKAYKGYGAPAAEDFKDEYPQHQVRITKPFYLATCEVTVGQFRQFVKETGYKTDCEKGTVYNGAFAWIPEKKRFELGEAYSWRNASFPQTDDHPVVNVSWDDAAAFCKWLSGKDGKTYRLPTEAEWEYACRAGTTTRYSCGDDPEKLAAVGNVADASAKGRIPNDEVAIRAKDDYLFTAPVGKFKPNAFGLYDMHGNVWEWCQDWYDDYAAGQAIDPSGPASGSDRVCRGGSWFHGAWGCRSAARAHVPPAQAQSYLGFRVARSVGD
jgi:formylglycine-generating enzyme